MSSKVGRNDPCPCGSGKKHKKCCLARDQAEERQAAALAADDGDWIADDEVDDDDSLVRAKPFDLSALQRVRYERGFFENEHRLMRGHGLQVTEWTAPDIPPEILESLAVESLAELEGRWGDPHTGTPIQADIIELFTDDDDDVFVEVYNRAITLLRGNDDRVKRIHRVCGVLEKAARSGSDTSTTPPEIGNRDGEFDMTALSEKHLENPGMCVLCGESLTHDVATAHLTQCAPRHDAKTGALVVILHLRVRSPELTGYWLDVEMLQDAPLALLDRLLRAVWLECCGHLSMFAFEGAEYHSNKESLDEWGPGPVPRRTMATQLKTAAQKESVFTYKYDFGSTTALRIEVLGHRSGRRGRTRARLLARNTEPTWPCGVCGQPATVVCAVCRHDSVNPFACDAHSERHICGEDEAFLPVVNSPRLGVCGYGREQ